MPPTHLHFDCFSGISGDMTLGALVDLGVDVAALQAGLKNLPIGNFSLRAERVMRQGIAGIRVHVEVEEEGHVHRHLSEVYAIVDAANLPPRALDRAKRAYLKLAEAEAHVHGTTVERIHFHEVGAKDAIVDIAGTMLALELLGIESISVGTITVGFGMIQCAHGTMPVPAPATAQLLLGLSLVAGDIEGEMVTPTGAAILQALLEEDSNSISQDPRNSVDAKQSEKNHAHTHEHAHTNEHTHGHSHSHSHEHSHEPSHNHEHSHEHPHDHAHHDPHFHEHPHQHAPARPRPGVNTSELLALKIGYGAGGRELAGRPNYLRLLLCESPTQKNSEMPVERHQVLVLETEIDDMQPEIAGYVLERLLGLGAFDVQIQPVQMKKNRPGLRLRVLADPAHESKLAECILRETSTFGVRRQIIERHCLRREMMTVETKLGPVRFKLGYWGDQIIKASPEFEDCRKIAEKNGLALHDVYARARHAYEHAIKH